MGYARVGSESSGPVELYYEDHGSGDPVVLIHGWPLSGRSWENQVPALVGFSMGGGEVVRHISRYGSERVSKAVLAAAVPPYLYQSDDNPDGGLDDATIETFENGVKGDRLAFLEEFTKNFFAAGEKADLVSEPNRLYNRDIAAFASPKGTLDCIAAFGRTEFRDDLSKIDVPTLIIHGDSDGIVPFEVSGKRSHEAISNSSLELIEGAPHGLNATHAEQFNRALLDFLE